MKTFVTCLLLAAILIPAAWAEPQWFMANRLYGDRKARNVGDLLTILIVEEASSSKDASKSTDKKFTSAGSISINSPTVDYVPRASWTNAGIPTWNFDMNRAYSGKGSQENKDELKGTIAARVIEVLPNGNLMIEGKRRLVMQNESVEVILTGTVRTEDITRNNTVESTDVADASIQYVSTGSIAQNQKQGIIPALWDWLNPF